jgi:hypothetical protein
MTKPRQGISALWARTAWARIWDAYSASDPGLLRLTAALRTVGSIVLTLAVLAGLGLPAGLLVAGAISAMAATFAITEPLPRDQAVTLSLGLPTALLAVTLGALLDPYILAGDLTFLGWIFAAVYVRRFGDRGTSLGLIGFQIYFVSLFVHARTAMLPQLYGVLAAAVCCAAVSRFALVPATPERTLSQLRRAFRTRLAQLVQTQEELVGEAERDETEGAPAAHGSGKTVDELRRQTARLHECALMIQGRLEAGTRDEAAASVLQRRIADAEIAAERLGVMLLKSRHRAGARIERNLRVLIRRLEDDESGSVVESGASVAASLVPGEPLGQGTVALRVLRHVQRLDEGVVGLARPLGVPAESARDRTAGATPRGRRAAGQVPSPGRPW